MVQEAVARTVNAGIPFDVAFVDTDFFINNEDFTLDPIVRRFQLISLKLHLNVDFRTGLVFTTTLDGCILKICMLL